MRNILFTFSVIIILQLTVFSQQPTIEWDKSLGGYSGGEKAESIQQTSDNGYIVTGFTSSNDGDVYGFHGGTDYWVIKLSSVGDTVWTRCYGGMDIDKAYSIKQTSDGGYIMAGESASTDGDVTGNHGGLDYWVLKINSVGVIEWEKSYGGSGDDKANNIVQTNDGGYIVVGSTGSGDGDVWGQNGGMNPADYWILKLNSVGDTIWTRCYGGTSPEIAYSVHQTFDDGYIVVGEASSDDGDVSGNNGYSDYWFVRLDANGDTLWTRSYGGSSWDVPISGQQTSDSGYIASGVTYSNDGNVSGAHGMCDYWVIKLNISGDIVWEKCYGGSDEDYANCIQQTTDGGYIVAGGSKSVDGDVWDSHGGYEAEEYWLVKLNPSGDTIWTKCLGGTETDIPKEIQQTSDNGYVVAGVTYSMDGDVTGFHNYWDYWVVKLAGSATPVLTTSAINSSCGFADGSASVSVTEGLPPYTYSWSPTGYTGADTDTYSDLPAGAYWVTVTDANWVSVITVVHVNDGTAATITTDNYTDACYGDCNGTVMISATGGVSPYNYSWSSSGNTSSYENNLCPGIVVVSVTDADDCVTSIDVDILETIPLAATHMILNHVSCYGENDGIASVAPDGGSPPYEYYWPDGITTAQNDSLTAGLHSVTIVDVNGCMATTEFTINQNPLLNAMIAGSSDVICSEGCSGAATVIVSGGDNNYTYLWNTIAPEQTTPTAVNLCAGDYIVTVTDGIGCIATASVSISENPPVVSEVSGLIDITCEGSCNGSVTLSSVGGVLPYSYEWSAGASSTTNFAENLCNGVFYVTTSDSAGCADIDTITIAAFSPYEEENICVVTVDDATGLYKIVWEKTPDQGIAAYTVYRQLTASIWTAVGTVLYDDMSELLDYQSTPEVHTELYKLKVIDTCGNESDYSPYHRPIHLGLSQGIPGTMVLDWTDYIDESSVFIPEQYYIFRGPTPGSLELYDSITSTVTEYNDIGVTQLYYYRIGVAKPEACIPTSTDKDQGGPYSQSFSNLEDNAVYVGIKSITTAGSMRISPNPFSDRASIYLGNSNIQSYKLILRDVTGRIVRIEIGNAENTIDFERGNLDPGLYYVELEGNKVFSGKIVITN